MMKASEVEHIIIQMQGTGTQDADRKTRRQVGVRRLDPSRWGILDGLGQLKK